MSLGDWVGWVYITERWSDIWRIRIFKKTVLMVHSDQQISLFIHYVLLSDLPDTESVDLHPVPSAHQ